MLTFYRVVNFAIPAGLLALSLAFTYNLVSL